MKKRINSNKFRSGWWLRLAALLVFATLVVVLIICFRPRTNLRGLVREKEITDALHHGDYVRLVKIHTELSASDKANNDNFRKSQAYIENLICNRQKEIFQKLVQGTRLDAAQVNELSQLFGFDSSTITTLFDDKSADFLSGRITEDEYIHLSNELLKVPDFYRIYGNLVKDYAMLSKAREVLAAPMQLLPSSHDEILKSDYLDFYKFLHAMEAVKADNSECFAVKIVAKFYQVEYKKAADMFYQKAVAKVRETQKADRYYDASVDLNRLTEFFANDATVLDLLKLNMQKMSYKVTDYEGPLPVIAVYPLCAAPKTETAAYKLFHKTHFSTAEFKLLLQTLYERNYVLANPETVYQSVVNGDSVKAPEGKTPFILLFEEENFAPKDKAYGVMQRLQVGKNDKLQGISWQNNELSGNGQNEIEILENFCTQHTDFSFNGARAIIASSDQHNIFGVSPSTPAHVSEIADIYRLLCQKQYQMASYGYDDLNLQDISPAELQDDFSKLKTFWQKVKLPMPQILIYKDGLHVLYDDNKCRLIRENGFTMHMGGGAEYAYNILDNKLMYMARFILTPQKLQEQSDDLAFLDIFN